MSATPSSPAATSPLATCADDLLLPFRTARSGVIGKIVRMGPLVDTILRRHDEPAMVSEALAQALTLSALLGSTLRPDSRLILQTKSDGPLGFLIVNFETPGLLRGYASLAKDRAADFAAIEAARDQGRLLGHGHLAMTIDPGGDMPSYQGIVALDGHSLTDTALTYFRQSEQLPTFLRLAVARQLAPPSPGAPPEWTWRAGGLLLQYLASEVSAVGSTNDAANVSHDDLDDHDDDAWQRVRTLAETVEDHELIDPSLSSERLLYRLFHEEGVMVSKAQPLRDYCRCSRDRVLNLLRSFGRADIEDLRDDSGKLAVKCEFCCTEYLVSPDELG